MSKVPGPIRPLGPFGARIRTDGGTAHGNTPNVESALAPPVRRGDSHWTAAHRNGRKRNSGALGRRSRGVIYGLPVVHGPYSLRRIQTNSKASTAAAMPIRIAARWRGTSVPETNGEPSAGGRGGSPPADGM